MNFRKRMLFRELLKEKIRTSLLIKKVLLLDENNNARDFRGEHGEKIEASLYELPRKSICGMYPKQTIKKYASITGFEQASSEVLDYVLAEQDRTIIVDFADMIEDELKKGAKP